MNKRIFALVFFALALACTLYPPALDGRNNPTGRMFLLTPRVTYDYWGWDDFTKRSVPMKGARPLRVHWSQLLAECAAAAAVAGLVGVAATYRRTA